METSKTGLSSICNNYPVVFGSISLYWGVRWGYLILSPPIRLLTCTPAPPACFPAISAWDVAAKFYVVLCRITLCDTRNLPPPSRSWASQRQADWRCKSQRQADWRRKSQRQANWRCKSPCKSPFKRDIERNIRSMHPKAGANLGDSAWSSWCKLILSLRNKFNGPQWSVTAIRLACVGIDVCPRHSDFTLIMPDQKHINNPFIQPFHLLCNTSDLSLKRPYF